MHLDDIEIYRSDTRKKTEVCMFYKCFVQKKLKERDKISTTVARKTLEFSSKPK